jgi:hypothetical protein
MLGLLLATFLIQTTFAETSVCPQTANAWNEWRRLTISNLQSPTDLTNGVFDLLNSCQSEHDQQKFFKSPAFIACMNPLTLAAENAKLITKDSVLNTSIFLDTPKSSMTSSDRPEVETLPDVFKSKGFVEASTHKGLTEEQVSALMVKVQVIYPNATIVRFKSRFGIGDKSILIRIPGPKVDRWVHMTLEDEGLGQAMFMIGVEKEDATGNKLVPPRSFFNSFVNVSVSDGDLAQPSPTSDNASAKNPHKEMLKGIVITPTTVRPLRVSSPQISCYVCHRTGAMPAVPDSSSQNSWVSDPASAPISYTPGKNATDAISGFNAAIAETATAIPRGVNIDHLGPAIGPVSPTSRTDDFVKSCFSSPEASTLSVSNVKQAMNCMGCHDGTSVGKLTFPLGFDPTTEGFTPANVLHQMILSGHMPPGSSLTNDERAALDRCIVKEYYGGFQSLIPGSTPGIYLQSLTQMKCPADTLKEEANASDQNKQGNADIQSEASTPKPKPAAPAQ